MRSTWKHRLMVPVLAVAILAAGCSDQFPQPERLLGPDTAPLMAKGGKSDQAKDKKEAKKQEREQKKQEKKARKGPKIKAKKNNGQEVEYQLAVKQRKSDKAPVSAWVDGSAEVQLEVGGHTLTIPRGIVDRPTLFSMKIDQRTYQDETVVEAVQLHAFQVEGKGRRARTEDIGAQGFGAYSVELCFNYQGADYETLSNVLAASLVYLSPDGRSNEVIESQADLSSETICGGVNHFSDYGLAWP